MDFRTLECEDINGGFKLTYPNEGTVSEKRSLRREKLAYELKQKDFSLAGLDKAGSGLGWPDLAWVDAGWPGHAWGSGAWVRRSPRSATRLGQLFARGDRFRSDQREKEKDEEKKEGRKKKKRKGGEKEREREKRERRKRKKSEARVFVWLQIPII